MSSHATSGWHVPTFCWYDHNGNYWCKQLSATVCSSNILLLWIHILLMSGATVHSQNVTGPEDMNDNCRKMTTHKLWIGISLLHQLRHSFHCHPHCCILVLQYLRFSHSFHVNEQQTNTHPNKQMRPSSTIMLKLITVQTVNFTVGQQIIYYKLIHKYHTTS
jgi:hypothetical protein